MNFIKKYKKHINFILQNSKYKYLVSNSSFYPYQGLMLDNKKSIIKRLKKIRKLYKKETIAEFKKDKEILTDEILNNILSNIKIQFSKIQPEIQCNELFNNELFYYFNNKKEMLDSFKNKIINNEFNLKEDERLFVLLKDKNIIYSYTPQKFDKLFFKIEKLRIKFAKAKNKILK